MNLQIIPGRKSPFSIVMLPRNFSTLPPAPSFKVLPWPCSCFLTPFLRGGAGIAVLLNHAFEIPMSLGLWLANFIFLAFTVPYLDGVSAFGTIFVITVTSVSVNFFEVFLEPRSATYGSIFYSARLFSEQVSPSS